MKECNSKNASDTTDKLLHSERFKNLLACEGKGKWTKQRDGEGDYTAEPLSPHYFPGSAGYHS